LASDQGGSDCGAAGIVSSLGMDASSDVGKARGGSRSFAKTLSTLGTSSTAH
jgi:hypothetical protein